MIDDQELRAIQFLAERVRKATAGAGPWDSHGLTANLRKLAGRNLHLTIEHVLRHAADPTAKTPGVLAGSFTPAAPTGGGHFRPPKRDEACRICGGWCAPGHCLRDGYGPDDDNEPHREHHADAAFDASLARAQLALAKAQTCDCGMRRELCKTHRPEPEPTAEETP